MSSEDKNLVETKKVYEPRIAYLSNGVVLKSHDGKWFDEEGKEVKM